MRKRLLCVIALLICCEVAVGFTAIKSEEETSDIKYEYDELNRVTKETYPNGTTIVYRYDKNGNLLETIVSEGITNTETGEINMVKGEDSETGVPEGNPSGKENNRINGNGNHITAVSGREPENSITENLITENGMTDLEAGEKQAILPAVANKDMAEHRFAPGIAVIWNTRWITIIFLIAILAGGTVWKIKKSQMQKIKER